MKALRLSRSLAISSSCHFVKRGAEREMKLRNTPATQMSKSLDALHLSLHSPPAQTSWGRPR